MAENERIFTFQYNNGVAIVHGDPFAVYRKLAQLLDGDPEGVLNASQPAAGKEEAGASVQRLAAEGRLVDAVREAFGMAPVDPATGAGATEWHCHAALDRYLEYADAQKKTRASSPTSA